MNTQPILGSIDADRVRLISNLSLQLDNGSLLEWHCETIKAARPNFVTGGVYRIWGSTRVDGRIDRSRSWSLIIKIILADPNRDDPTHYNYWRREIEAYKSGYLRHLPAGMKAPECYAIDENDDGSVWLWLEDMTHESREWQWDDYAYAATKLGEFQGAYLVGGPIPDLRWANRQWMRSWIHECQTYRTLSSTDVASDSNPRLEAIIDRFNQCELLIQDWLVELERLPRTIAHQDFYELNIMLDNAYTRDRKLAVIDWQFASISGIGEDLGRFLGLSLSRGNVPADQFHDYKELLITSYMEGLGRAGWHGDESLPRFGYLAAFALRSVWEVPKLLRKMEQDAKSEACQRLLLLTELQMEAANEAERLRPLGFIPGKNQVRV